MTPRRWGVGGWLVAVAAGLVAAGGLVGLLVWDRRYFLLALAVGTSHYLAYRIPNRNLIAELEAAQMRLSAYNASDSRADLAEAPLTPPGGTELYDQDTEPNVCLMPNDDGVDWCGHRVDGTWVSPTGEHREVCADHGLYLEHWDWSRAEDPTEQPFVHTPCGTPISVLDDGAEWCPTCGTFLDPEPLPDLDASDGPRSLPRID